jgi:hypothetical protein
MVTSVPWQLRSSTHRALDRVDRLPGDVRRGIPRGTEEKSETVLSRPPDQDK